MSSAFPINYFFKSVILILALVATVGIEIVGQKAENEIVPVKKCWEYKADGLSDRPTAADQSSVYVTTGDGRVSSIEIQSGKILWTSEIGGQVISNILATDFAVYIVSNAVKDIPITSAHSMLRSLSKATGIVNWSVKLPFSEQVFLGGTSNGISAVAANGLLVGLNEANGSLSWRKTFSGELSAHPQFSTNNIAIGTSERKIHIFSATNGDLLFSRETEFAPSAIYLNGGNKIAYGDDRGNLISRDLKDGEIAWKFKTGARIVNISEGSDGALVAASADNFIYSLSAGNGNVEWKKRMPARVSDVEPVNKNLTVFAVSGENTVFLIDLERGKLLNQITIDGTDAIPRWPVAVTASKFTITAPESVISYAINSCSEK